MKRRPALPLVPSQERQWGSQVLLHSLGRALRRHAGMPVQIALRPAAQAGRSLPANDMPWPVDLHVAGLDTAQLELALRRWQTEASGDNPVHLLGWTPPLPWIAPASSTADAHSPAEVALDFTGPLPFKRPTASRTFFTAQGLVDLVLKRIRQVFGPDPLMLAGWLLPAPRPVVWAENLELLCGHWHFVEVRRASGSAQSRLSAAERRSRLIEAPTGASGLHEQSHAGCMGKLYLRGPALAELLPWLRTLEPWHLAAQGGVAVWSPHQVLAPAPTAFDALLTDQRVLLQVARDVAADHDRPVDDPVPPLDEQTLAFDAAHALATGSFEFGPTQAFQIARADGGSRTVERLQPRDLVVQRHLLHLLAPVLDRAFSPASMGFRKGLSRHDAIARVRELLAQGHDWVVEADIDAFFPSIDHGVLQAAIDRALPRADRLTRAALAAAVSQSSQSGRADPMPRVRGVAQGAPLSPLLANLVLDRIDHAIEERFGASLVRYADDFVLLLRSESEARSALVAVAHMLGELRLDLAPSKTGIRHASQGFDFVGERFDASGGVVSGTSVNNQRKPLVLTDPGLGLSLNGEALDIRREGALLQTVPLRRVSEILLFGRLHISTALMERCARMRIPIAISLPGGRQMATLTPHSREFHDIAWLQARWYHALGNTDRAAIAASLLEAKLAGYATLVSRRRPIDRDTLATLHRCMVAIDGCYDVAVLRGHEGVAARACFAWLQRQFKADACPAFQAPRRERLAGDRLNTLLNFGYYLSFSHLNALVRAHGLNPYLGFLHDGMDDYETLVADLQELVRPFVDRLIVQLVNMGYVRATDFVPVPRGLYLAKPAARKVALAFEHMMGEDAGGHTLRDSLLMQVRVLRQYMGQGGPNWWFHMGHGQQEGAGAAAPTSDMLDSDDHLDHALALEVEASADVGADLGADHKVAARVDVACQEDATRHEAADRRSP